jgi:hypothetical protein
MNRKAVPNGQNGEKLIEVTGNVSDAKVFIPVDKNVYLKSPYDKVKKKYYLRELIVYNQYYGRGYVQITHQDNYQAMDNALGLNGKLHLNPDLAFQNYDISYRIMSYGMANGSYQGNKAYVEGRGFIGGYKLSDYLNRTLTDYISARKIINGDGNGNLVAGYAKVFQAMYELLAE